MVFTPAAWYQRTCSSGDASAQWPGSANLPPAQLKSMQNALRRFGNFVAACAGPAVRAATEDATNNLRFRIMTPPAPAPATAAAPRQTERAGDARRPAAHRQEATPRSAGRA